MGTRGSDAIVDLHALYFATKYREDFDVLAVTLAAEARDGHDEYRFDVGRPVPDDLADAATDGIVPCG